MCKQGPHCDGHARESYARGGIASDECVATTVCIDQLSVSFTAPLCC